MEQGWAWCGEEFVDQGVGDLVTNQPQYTNQKGPTTANVETVPQWVTDTFEFSNHVELSSTRDIANLSNSQPARGFSLFDEWSPNYYNASGHDLTNPKIQKSALQNTGDTQHQNYEGNVPFTQGFGNSYLTDFNPTIFLESVAQESTGSQNGNSPQEGISGSNQTITAPELTSTKKRVPSQLSTTPKSPEEAKDILYTPITATDISTSWIIEKTTLWLQKTKITKQLFCKNILDCGIKTFRKFTSLQQSWEEIDTEKCKKICVRMYNFILIPDSIKRVYLKMNLYNAIKQKKTVNRTASSSVVPIQQNYRVFYEEINKSTARDLHFIKMRELRNKLDEYEKLIATNPKSLEDVQKMLNATIPYTNLIDTASDRMEIITWQQSTNCDMVYSVDRIIGCPKDYLEHATIEVPPFSEMNAKSQQIHTRMHNWLLFTEEIKSRILNFTALGISQEQGDYHKNKTASNSNND
ncbi:hypothetical protein L5515_017050 [Caenorhabditis briggsae]|uniref:Uncharacterized protein n=1 Tax=Caenorhabditis briggsae TaxID=6238 RepID=A0AAE9FCB8_CAEBR|nr:hypothetical protein L5515_017050 [Caenorhabditis briggsae]